MSKTNQQKKVQTDHQGKVCLVTDSGYMHK